MKGKRKPTIGGLVELIGKLKSEHQRAVFKLNKLNEKLADELSAEKEKNIESEKIIQMLRKENAELMCEVNKNMKSDAEEKEEEYEVETIIDDKMQKRKKYYLVKWKDYGGDENEWVLKSNLHCKDLLDEYEKSKQTKRQLIRTRQHKP